MDRVPQIDFEPFRSGDSAARKAVSAEIGRACREIGFFTLTGHGLPLSRIADTFAESRRFFSAPAEIRDAIDVRRSPLNRGYHPPGGHSTNPLNRPDLKDSFEIAQDLGPDHPAVQAGWSFHGANHWPEGLPGFRETLSALYADLEALGREICRAFAMDLGAPEDFFETCLTCPMAQFRLIHYPPQPPEAPDNQFGAGAHTDYGCVALLMQDDAGGLQVLNRRDDWVDVPPVEGAIVCNVGEMMERWSNGLYPATPHRVINRSGRERYSQVMFFNPDYDALVEPLPSCVPDGAAPGYSSTTMGRFVEHMFAQTFTHNREAKAQPATGA